MRDQVVEVVCDHLRLPLPDRQLIDSRPADARRAPGCHVVELLHEDIADIDELLVIFVRVCRKREVFVSVVRLHLLQLGHGLASGLEKPDRELLGLFETRQLLHHLSNTSIGHIVVLQTTSSMRSGGSAVWGLM